MSAPVDQKPRPGLSPTADLHCGNRRARMGRWFFKLTALAASWIWAASAVAGVGQEEGAWAFGREDHHASRIHVRAVCSHEGDVRMDYVVRSSVRRFSTSTAFVTLRHHAFGEVVVSPLSGDDLNDAKRRMQFGAFPLGQIAGEVTP